MATYSVNKAAVAHCRKLIEAKQYVLDSDWGESQPRAPDEKAPTVLKPQDFSRALASAAQAAWLMP